MTVDTERTITLTVNGVPREATVPVRRLLSDALRHDLGLTGTHVGCDTSNCGACTVHLNGDAVKSCTLLAAQAIKLWTIARFRLGGSLDAPTLLPVLARQLPGEPASERGASDRGG